MSKSSLCLRWGSTLEEEDQRGAYVLRLCLAQETRLSFGRFKKGKEIALPAGEYAYVGSAMAIRGPASLAGRLMRHASRSHGKPPHPFRRELAAHLKAVGLGRSGLRPPRDKTPRWHIDYLLDLEVAELIGVLILRFPVPLEGAVARILAEDPHTQIVEPGLGATDATGCTHLLRVLAEERWWIELAARLQDLVAGKAKGLLASRGGDLLHETLLYLGHAPSLDLGRDL